MRFVRVWAVAGVVALLLRSALGLAETGWSGTVASGLTPIESVALVVVVGLFAWGEGVLALGRSWAPFVARRVRSLDGSGSPLRRVLAPLWAVGLVTSDRRILARTWLAVAAIVGAVLVVRRIPHPWRGMIELGVASALVVGAVALVVVYLAEGRPGDGELGDGEFGDGERGDGELGEGPPIRAGRVDRTLGT